MPRAVAEFLVWQQTAGRHEALPTFDNDEREAIAKVLGSTKAPGRHVAEDGAK